MKRTETIRTAALIALPFLLLPAAYWLAVAMPGRLSANEAEHAARVLLRAAYIGGAVLGLLAGRPIWFYPWLGFAVYEAVAVMMLLVERFIPDGWRLIAGAGMDFFLFGLLPEFGEPVPRLLRVSLFLLVFSPFFATALWVGWRRSQRPLAIYTVFPQAALTLLLYLSIKFGPVTVAETVVIIPPAVASAVVAIFFWRLPPVVAPRLKNGDHVLVLYAGVPLVHLCYFLGVVLVKGEFAAEPFIIFFPLFTYVGWFILTIPLLLPLLLQLLIRELKSRIAFGRLARQG